MCGRRRIGKSTVPSARNGDNHYRCTLFHLGISASKLHKHQRICSGLLHMIKRVVVYRHVLFMSKFQRLPFEDFGKNFQDSYIYLQDVYPQNIHLQNMYQNIHKHVQILSKVFRNHLKKIKTQHSSSQNVRRFFKT